MGQPMPFCLWKLAQAISSAANKINQFIEPPQRVILGNELLVNVVAKPGQQDKLIGLDNCAEKIGYNRHDGHF